MLVACVMNLISFETAYSLYPKETFETRRLLIFEYASPNQDIARAKYASRGWELLGNVTDDEKTSLYSSLRQGVRWIGDSFSWSLPLGSEDVDLSRCLTPRPIFPIKDCLALHSWELSYCPSASIYFEILESPALKTNYTMGNDALLTFLYPKVKHASIQLEREGHILRHRLAEGDL
jgi:hypothetical protein